MDEREITAAWALIDKAPGRIGYEIVGSSGDIGDYPWRYVSGTPSSSVPPDAPTAPPWLTFAPFPDRPETLFSVSVLDWRKERDEAGRPIWPRSFFLMSYQDIAAAGASYRGLWDAVRDIRLPSSAGPSRRLTVRSPSRGELAETIRQIGIEPVAVAAAYLLDGRQVALTGHELARLDRLDRLAALDAVFALLPYGFRAGLSASTGVNNPIDHRISLVFAESVRRAELASQQVRVSLSEPTVAPPNGLSREYLRHLFRVIEEYGLDVLVAHLWAARDEHSVERPGEALWRLDELSRRYTTGRLPDAAAEPPETQAPLPEPEPSHPGLGRVEPQPADTDVSPSEPPPTSMAPDVPDTSGSHEPVRFVVSYPRALSVGIRGPLYVHVYFDGIHSRLEARLAELADRLGPEPRGDGGQAASIIPQPAELEIQPVIDHVYCYPPRKTVVWRGELSEADFEIECADPGVAATRKRCGGSVFVFLQGLLVAKIDVSVMVTTKQGALPGSLEISEGRTPERIFGSYAHQDIKIVEAFRAIYETANIKLFTYARNMEAGAVWRQSLEEEVERSELFELFWSDASAASSEVEREWRYALTIAPHRQRSPDSFIRVTSWKKPVPVIPDELSRYHHIHIDDIFGSGKGFFQWLRKTARSWFGR